MTKSRSKDQYLNLYPKVNKAEVKKTFKYDEDTGRVYRFRKEWKICARMAMGHSDRYMCVINYTVVQIPDIAWLLCKGDWPKEPLAALDGNMKNTRIDNLVLESSTLKQYGNMLVKPKSGRFGEWEVKVWHHPYFYRGNVFKSPTQARKWGEAQLKLYNKYAFFTEAGAQETSEEKETPITGVYDHKPRNLYMVKVRLNGSFKHYSYEKNIEDAIEAQLRGQAEIEEIWKSIPPQDPKNNTFGREPKVETE